MTKVTVDEPLLSKLDSFTVPVVLCDKSGRTLGHFVPICTAGQAAPDDCPYTEEELVLMQQETGGHTLEEIWKSLGRT